MKRRRHAGGRERLPCVSSMYSSDCNHGGLSLEKKPRRALLMHWPRSGLCSSPQEVAT